MFKKAMQTSNSNLPTSIFDYGNTRSLSQSLHSDDVVIWRNIWRHWKRAHKRPQTAINVSVYIHLVPSSFVFIFLSFACAQNSRNIPGRIQLSTNGLKSKRNITWFQIGQKWKLDTISPEQSLGMHMIRFSEWIFIQQQKLKIHVQSGSVYST